MGEVEASGAKKTASVLWSLGCAALIMLVMAAIAGPKLVSSRLHGNESAAIGALKTLNNAQQLYREKGNVSFGDLEALMGAEAIDQVLGGGTKQGYRFECAASTAQPASAWAATAAPLTPGTTGDRYFAINHEGVVYYTSTAPIEVDPASCAMPDGVQPVGR